MIIAGPTTGPIKYSRLSGDYNNYWSTKFAAGHDIIQEYIISATFSSQVFMLLSGYIEKTEWKWVWQLKWKIILATSKRHIPAGFVYKYVALHFMETKLLMLQWKHVLSRHLLSRLMALPKSLTAFQTKLRSGSAKQVSHTGLKPYKRLITLQLPLSSRKLSELSTPAKWIILALTKLTLRPIRF